MQWTTCGEMELLQLQQVHKSCSIEISGCWQDSADQPLAGILQVCKAGEKGPVTKGC
jgi:hypothetical protein